MLVLTGDDFILDPFEERRRNLIFKSQCQMGCLSSGLKSPVNGGIQHICALEGEPLVGNGFERLAFSFEGHAGHLVNPVERVTGFCLLQRF